MKTDFQANVTLKNGETATVRGIAEQDVEPLAKFFAGLGESTRSRFGPHPLDDEQAFILCNKIERDDYKRLIAILNDTVVGYFLLGYQVPEHEQLRYRLYEVELLHHADIIFAPCVADDMQDQGVASAVMPHIVSYAKQQHARSLVLLGGTQAPNERAVHFYKKFGFVILGSFLSHVKNHDMWLPLRDGVD